MKKHLLAYSSTVALLAILVSGTNANACTNGVADGTVTTDGRPLLWKSRINITDPNNIVEYCTGSTYNYLSVHGSTMGTCMGVNSAGLAMGDVSGTGTVNQVYINFLNYCLSHFSTVDQVRSYLQQQRDAGTLQLGAKEPVMDALGNAAIFEVDKLNPIYEYNTRDPDRAAQGRLGWVVRWAYHNRSDGTDNLSLGQYDQAGSYNIAGLVSLNQLSAKTIMQGNNGANGYEFMRYGPGRSLTTIPTARSDVSSMVVQGVAPSEDPALTTMWVAMGNANYSLAVPTWVKVAVVPQCLSTSATALRVQSLEAKGNEATVQASTLPAEAHLFAEVDELLNHWRSDGTPSVAELTRVETRMADDAYSLLNCLDTVQSNNLAPTAAFDATATGVHAWQFIVAANDADGSISKYEWNFGDQATSNAISPTHTYSGPGWYLVSCTVTDDDGVTTTDWGYVHAVPEPSAVMLLFCAAAIVPLFRLCRRLVAKSRMVQWSRVSL